jgi:hypothetical protein
MICSRQAFTKYRWIRIPCYSYARWRLSTGSGSGNDECLAVRRMAEAAVATQALPIPTLTYEILHRLPEDLSHRP